VRACVCSFVSKTKRETNSCQESRKTKVHRTAAHARRIIRTASLFPATGLIIPDDDPTRLPAPAIDRRAAPPTAVATGARGATMPVLPTRDVGGRRPEGRGPVPAPAPPGTNEALDAVPRGGLPCWDVGARRGTDSDALLACAPGRWTPPRNMVRGGAADEEGAEKLEEVAVVLRTSVLLAFLVMRKAAVVAIGAGSAEIDARALRLGNAAGTGGAGTGCVGAGRRFVLGRMNCRTGSDGVGTGWLVNFNGGVEVIPSLLSLAALMPVSTNVPGLVAASSSSDAMSISLSRSDNTSSVSESPSCSVSAFSIASNSLPPLAFAGVITPNTSPSESKSISRSPIESFSGSEIFSLSKSNDDSPKWTLRLACRSTDMRRASTSGDTPSVAPGRSCLRVGEGDGGAAGVTAMQGADGVGGVEGVVVPFMALMTDARGEEDGAAVGRTRQKDDGDPNSGVTTAADGPPFFGMDMGLLRLLPPSPSAMSARGRR